MAYTLRPVTRHEEYYYYLTSHAPELDEWAQGEPCAMMQNPMITNLEVTTEVTENQTWDYPGETPVTLSAEDFNIAFPSLPGYSDVYCDMWPYIMPSGDIDIVRQVLTYSAQEDTHHDPPDLCIWVLTYGYIDYNIFITQKRTPEIILPALAAGLIASAFLVSGIAGGAATYRELQRRL